MPKPEEMKQADPLLGYGGGGAAAPGKASLTAAMATVLKKKSEARTDDYVEQARAAYEPATASGGDILVEAHRIAEAMFEPRDVSFAILSQANLRRKRMEHIDSRHGLLTSEQVADQFGSEARNRGSVASRWLSGGEIFAVQAAGKQRFPGFQFDEDGRPRKVIAEILKALPFEEGWEIAHWFDTPHASLPRKVVPADHLRKDPDRVLEAARQTRRQADAW